MKQALPARAGICSPHACGVPCVCVCASKREFCSAKGRRAKLTTRRPSWKFTKRKRGKTLRNVQTPGNCFATRVPGTGGFHQPSDNICARARAPGDLLTRPTGGDGAAPEFLHLRGRGRVIIFESRPWCSENIAAHMSPGTLPQVICAARASPPRFLDKKRCR